MENETILINVYNSNEDKVANNNYMQFEFETNNKKMQSFISLCLEQNKYLVIFKNNKKAVINEKNR